MAEQLYIVRIIRDNRNIRDFTKFLGKEVEDLTKDLIKYVVELYLEPDYSIEIDKNESK